MKSQIKNEKKNEKWLFNAYPPNLLNTFVAFSLNPPIDSIFISDRTSNYLFVSNGFMNLFQFPRINSDLFVETQFDFHSN